VVAEIVADRCGARHIHAVLAAQILRNLHDGDQEFTRRAAADLISTLLMGRVDAAHSKIEFQSLDSYLYPPLRMSILGGEVGLGPDGRGLKGPAICGGAAEALVETAQLTYKKYPGNGLMPDEMENLLPTGVVDAWERKAAWTTASFACQ
jgi:hypothetical protein